MTRGEFRDSTSRYMCTIPIVFIQYCCSSLPVVAVGSAYSRSLRVAAPLGTVASALRLRTPPRCACGTARCVRAGTTPCAVKTDTY